MLDISDTSVPALADTATYGGPSWDIAVAGGYAFLGGGENGLLIVEAQ